MQVQLSTKPNFTIGVVGSVQYQNVGTTMLFDNEEYAEERNKIRARFRNLSFIDYAQIKVSKVFIQGYYCGKRASAPYCPWNYSTKKWCDSPNIEDHINFDLGKDDVYRGYYSSFKGWGYKVTLPLRGSISVEILITTREYVEEFLKHPSVVNADKGFKFLEEVNLDAFYIIGPVCERVAGTRDSEQVEIWNQPIAPEMWAGTRLLSGISRGYIGSGITELKLPGVIIASGNSAGGINKVLGSLKRGDIAQGQLTANRLA